MQSLPRTPTSLEIRKASNPPKLLQSRTSSLRELPALFCALVITNTQLGLYILSTLFHEASPRLHPRIFYAQCCREVSYSFPHVPNWNFSNPLTHFGTSKIRGLLWDQENTLAPEVYLLPQPRLRSRNATPGRVRRAQNGLQEVRSFNMLSPQRSLARWSNMRSIRWGNPKWYGENETGQGGWEIAKEDK